MSRAGQGAGLSRTAHIDTRIVAPRAKNLKPITQATNWDDLPTLPNETSKDVPLEFAKVVQRATPHL